MACRWEYAAQRQASEAIRRSLRDPWTGDWGYMPDGILSAAETIVWNYDPPEAPTVDLDRTRPDPEPATRGGAEPFGAWEPTQTRTPDPGDPEPEQLRMDCGTPRVL